MPQRDATDTFVGLLRIAGGEGVIGGLPGVRCELGFGESRFVPVGELCLDRRGLSGVRTQRCFDDEGVGGVARLCRVPGGDCPAAQQSDADQLLGCSIRGILLEGTQG